MEFDIYRVMDFFELSAQKSPYFELPETIAGNELLVRTIEPNIDSFSLATFEYLRVIIAMPVYNDVANWNDRYLIIIDANVIYFGISNETITDLTNSQIQNILDQIRAAI